MDVTEGYTLNIVIVSGGFDPLHSGHIAYFEYAKKLGDKLIVAINSDDWLIRKKSRFFMPLSERMEIIHSIGVVDDVITFNDDDGTAKDAIKVVKYMYPDDDIIFANGGDRNHENIPEVNHYINDNRVTFAYGIGGNYKKNSSSWVLNDWAAPKTERIWGYYRVIYDQPSYKVKQLVVEPGKSLSMQKHEYRNEHWFVVNGVADVGLENNTKQLQPHQSIELPVGTWHQLKNASDIKPVEVVEIQYGEKCIEEDIDRKSINMCDNNYNGD